MLLRKLTVQDRKLFNKFLRLGQQELSAYAWENIYIWKDLFDIRWSLIKDSLCVFFRDRIGCFQYLAPLGEKMDPEVLKMSFRVMDAFNKNKEISRIENVARQGISFYQEAGFECRLRSYDYLCRRTDLAGLRGNRFKSKRASCNYFCKHTPFEYAPFSLKHKKGCLALHSLWVKQREASCEDPFYQGMLRDSGVCLRRALMSFSDLNLEGRLVFINKEIKAFTIGYELNRDTFCILYEITDLGVKGLAQFIFREFSKDLKGYRYINIMDDSGLSNLKTVKLSYKPAQLVPSFAVTRKND